MCCLQSRLLHIVARWAEVGQRETQQRSEQGRWRWWDGGGCEHMLGGMNGWNMPASGNAGHGWVLSKQSRNEQYGPRDGSVGQGSRSGKGQGLQNSGKHKAQVQQT